MNSELLPILMVVSSAGVGLWLVSIVVEAIRPEPRSPTFLRWAPNIPVSTVEVAGSKIRFIQSGTGPPLVLLHTLRTQLDLFEKIVPELSKTFSVFALDYPGHGYSDIPKTRYDASFFTDTIEGFLERLDLRRVTLAGVSIGGSIALIVGSRKNPRVERIVAINPYDYAKGRGLARSSLVGRIVTYASLVPVIGETVMRLRNFIIIKRILQGGVADKRSIPPELLNEMYQVGNRPGHYRAFLSLLRSAASWEIATQAYGNIDAPVLLIWGMQDWARPSEREHDRDLVPGAKMVTLDRGGHFLPLDQPQQLSNQIVRFARDNE
jgi:pimeloyl-ACP methyl ester carboxylesterase